MLARRARTGSPFAGQLLADFEIGQRSAGGAVQHSGTAPPACRKRVGVMPMRALNARLNGPMEP
jgi:hypothetical protein